MTSSYLSVEITIQPATSEQQTKLEVLVDDRDVHKLPAIKPGQSLRWDMQTYPCDIDPGSTIGLKLVEKHYLSPDREVIVEYKISDVTNETSITKDAGVFPSRLSSFGLTSKRSSTASSAKALTIKIKFLDSNQLHPIAKLVVGLFTKAWEYLEKNQKQHEDLERLLDGLTQMQPFIDSIKDRAKEPALEHVILALLLLIEDTSNYIINSMYQTNAG
ncbi:hypothetical protein BDV93DRAFT_514512 [Ceratobasidium sp. AG-I]|nr:hypothetical protein BDV93DRAFT_514512 [Ceratobasidium sp. AG-I]